MKTINEVLAKANTPTEVKRRVKLLTMDENGNVRERIPTWSEEGQLKQTLLTMLYPDIEVVAINLPDFHLDEFEKSQVTDRLKKVKFGNHLYLPVGATKEVVYAVSAEHEKVVMERFWNWPEAVIGYFGIMISECKSIAHFEGTRILLIEDYDSEKNNCTLGTNDCGAWATKAYFKQLSMPTDRLLQFRVAFDYENHAYQAKGTFKLLDQEVADFLNVDLILPKSCIKPGIDLASLEESKTWFGSNASPINGLRLTSKTVVGIRDHSRDASRPMRFAPSYTLVQYASDESMQLEIKPRAIKAIKAVVSAALANDYNPLLERIGSRATQDKTFDEESDEFTSYETSIVEAVLKSDGSGQLVRYPYINKRIQALLTRWVSRTATGGDWTMPGFGLCHDGYLFLHNGKIVTGSDWIPTDRALVDLDADRMLVVRYPIRMKEDLLPVRIARSEDAFALLQENVAAFSVPDEKLRQVVSAQLMLTGTLTLHSDTAAKNGGDFDFDTVAALTDKEFPLFVKDRFEMKNEYVVQKDKKEKVRSPKGNLAKAIMDSRNNQVGVITNMISDCVAHARFDLAYQLVKQLQNALDSFKHGTKVDRKVLQDIRDIVAPSLWLKAKEAKTLKELPAISIDHLPPTDRIGHLYITVMQEIKPIIDAPQKVSDFYYLLSGETATREMFDECKRWQSGHHAMIAAQIERLEPLELAEKQAKARYQALWENRPADDADRNIWEQYRQRKEAAKREWTKTSSKVRAQKKADAEESSAYAKQVHAWGSSIKENRRGYAQILWQLTTKSKNERTVGSLPFHAFPQEICDMLIEATGGRPVEIKVPRLPEGECIYDATGNVYQLKRIPVGNGEFREEYTFLFRLEPNGKILLQVGDGDSATLVPAGQVQPFAMQSGSGEIKKDGRVIFEKSTQRPTLRGRITSLRTTQERKDFLAEAERQYGPAFEVFVASDNTCLKIRNEQDRRVFLLQTESRPWQARPLAG